VAALVVRDLARRFGGVRALDGVSLEIAEGERRAVIGPNGAGKTTLFNMLAGELAPTSGSVELFGIDVTGARPWRVARDGLARVYQRAELFPSLTAAENLELAFAPHGPWPFGRRDRAAGVRAGGLLERVGLAGRDAARPSALSHGERRQLELAVALASDPRVLLLDEPTAGMSPAETARIVELIAALPRALTLLVIEHDMDVVFRLADRITVLHEGKVLAEGDPSTVRADPRVREVYLGAEATA